MALGAVIFVLAGAAFLAIGRGNQALASHVRCGDTITTDTRLDSDLINCPNNGIVIGADGVTLDLNGHTIDGTGTPFAGCAQRETCDSGVVAEGHDGVTVMHGSVREFAFTGVNLGPGRHIRVLDLFAVRNGFGIAFYKCVRCLVRNSSGSGSIPPTFSGAAGMLMIRSHHVRILHNSFRHNGNWGIRVEDSTHNLIRGSLLSRNQETAIILVDSNRNRVRYNRSVRGGEGILVANGNQNVIARNRVFGAGLKIEGGRGNLIARNLIARGAPEDGVHVDGQAKHTLLRRNRVRQSMDDGFDVESRTTKLTGNRAVGNVDLGFEAVRGVIDGGGNIARGNGDPRQCVNVACR